MEHGRSQRSGFSAIGISAVFSIIVLGGAFGWTFYQGLQAKDASAVAAAGAAADHSAIPGTNTEDGAIGVGQTGTTSDPFAADAITDNVAQKLADDYALMQESNYSPDQETQVAQQLGQGVKADVSYTTYTAADIPTSPDTSYAAMMKYRTALQISFKAMMQNKEAELDYLDEYEETQNPQYLTDLQEAANNYFTSASSTAKVTVPADAVSVQLGILNAMGEFAATLQSMSQSTQDPLAEAALVNTYLQAQQDMFTSFNNLYAYFKSKQPSS